MIRSACWSILAAGEVRDLQVEFTADPRSRILEVWIEQTDGRRIELDRLGNVARLNGAAGEGTLRVEFVGDTPLLHRVAGAGRFALFETTRTHPDADGPGQIDARSLLREFLRTHAWHPSPTPLPPPLITVEISEETEELKYRQREEAERTIAEARSFFFKLERTTQQDLDRVTRQRVFGHLDGRLLIRVGCGAKGRRARFRKLSPRRRMAPQLIEISGMMRTLVLAEVKHRLRAALELFATERLAVIPPSGAHSELLTQGVPNGADFFMFAEFALLCLENGVHADFWSENLVHFVYASHIYAEHGYVKPGLFLFDPLRAPYPVERLEALRAEYPLDLPRQALEDRFTYLVGKRLLSSFEPGGTEALDPDNEPRIAPRSRQDGAYLDSLVDELLERGQTMLADTKRS